MRKLISLAVTLACLRFAAAETVWIDTDVSIGSPIREVDDAYALVLAFSSPEIRVAGVSTTYGNAPLAATTRIARELAGQFGKNGMVRPEQVFAGASSAADLGRRSQASEALAKVLAKHSVTYIALGPLTNLATFLQLHPGSAPRIHRVIFVGGQADGATLVLGENRSFPIHDANVFKDWKATAAVLKTKIPLNLVPIETSSHLTLNEQDLRELEENDGSGRYLARRSGVWLWFWRHFARTSGGPIFDALAIVAAVRPEMIEGEKRSARMDEKGNLRVTRRQSAAATARGARAVRYYTGFAPETKKFVLKRLVTRRGRN